MKLVTPLLVFLSLVTVVAAHCCVHINVYEEAILPLLADTPVVELASCHISGQGICYYHHQDVTTSRVTASIFPVIDGTLVDIQPFETVVAQSFDAEHYTLWLTLDHSVDGIDTLLQWNARTILNDTEQATLHNFYTRISKAP